MKALHITLISLLFVAFAAFSPTQAQEISEGTYSLSRKESGNGLSITLQGQPQNVQAVLDKKFKAATGKKSKGMGSKRAIMGARFSRLSSSTMDYYFRTERVSKVEKDKSNVYLFISSGNGNFIDSNTYPDEMYAAREMLQDLQLEVNIYEMELVIREQEKVMERAIKGHEKMVRDSISLEQKLAHTLEAIEQNKINRANQLLNIDSEKMRLAEFKANLDRLRKGDVLSEDEFEFVDETNEIEIVDDPR